MCELNTSCDSCNLCEIIYSLKNEDDLDVLLDNALKHTKPAGKTITLTLPKEYWGEN